VRIWFDADNGPHVLIMRPLAAELSRRGHDVRFTARDRSGTCELLDLYTLPYTRVGHEFGVGRWRKIRGTLGRAVVLARKARPWRPDISFGHGSRSLPLAAGLLRIPSVTMYDYEWVNPTLFNLGCCTILLPEAVGVDRCRAAGVRVDRVRWYPGYKEHLYLDGCPLNPAPIVADLGLAQGNVKVLLRPPATAAHYHNPEAEKILVEILKHLAGYPSAQLVFLCRSEDQLGMLGEFPRERVVVPRRVYDGPSLVAAMDLVISGGGTMTREAAILGVPSYSFFRGRAGQVDECLEASGRLTMLRSVDQVREKLRVAPRSGEIGAPDSTPLVCFVCDEIESAARR